MLLRAARRSGARLLWPSHLSTLSPTHSSAPHSVEVSVRSPLELTSQITHDASAPTSAALTFANPFLYEDRALLVLNKPPGVCVQPNTSDPDESGLVKDLIEEYRRKRSIPSKIFPCHRIDRPTTGIVVCAKSTVTVREVAQQFSERTIEKTYLALVRTSRELRESGTIDAPLGRWKGRPCVAREPSKGVEAVTRWERLAVSPIAPIQLLKFAPKTGRKHQIRLHAAQVLRAPVLGDDLYAEMKRPRNHVQWRLPALPPGVLFLHNAHITLNRYRRTGPSKRFRLGITAPLHPHFVDACKTLEIPVPEEYLQGGVYVDGERAEGGVVEGVDGQWIEDLVQSEYVPPGPWTQGI